MTNYRHYKGNIYTLLYIGTHTETEEKLVIYKRKDDDKIWIRPYDMFFGKVEVGGELINRFTFLEEDYNFKYYEQKEDGITFIKMECLNCGGRNIEGSAYFCPYCGTRFK